MVSHTLPEIAFYYPNPMWHYGDWIKNLVLFFDGVALLVPERNLSTRLRVCREGQSTQPVQVWSKEVSVHLGSYPGDGEGNRPVEASGTEIRLGRVSECAGRNASEA